MLTNLHVKNLALIDEAEVRRSPAEKLRSPEWQAQKRHRTLLLT